LSEFAIHQGSGAAVVEVNGRLDALAAPQFDGALQAALQAGQGRVVVDLAGVGYLSSSCLRILLLGTRRARELAGDLKLCCLAPRVRQVLALAGFDLVFELWETRSQALAAFAPRDGSERVCTRA